MTRWIVEGSADSPMGLCMPFRKVFEAEAEAEAADMAIQAAQDIADADLTVISVLAVAS